MLRNGNQFEPDKLGSENWFWPSYISCGVMINCKL